MGGEEEARPSSHPAGKPCPLQAEPKFFLSLSPHRLRVTFWERTSCPPPVPPPRGSKPPHRRKILGSSPRPPIGHVWLGSRSPTLSHFSRITKCFLCSHTLSQNTVPLFCRLFVPLPTKNRPCPNSPFYFSTLCPTSYEKQTLS